MGGKVADGLFCYWFYELQYGESWNPKYRQHFGEIFSLGTLVSLFRGT